MSLRPVIVGLIFGLPFVSPPPLGAQGTCEPVFNALSKVVTTTAHVYNTSAPAPGSGAKPRSIETIYVGGAIYVYAGGKWARSPITPQQLVKQEQRNRQSGQYTCRYLRDESVNGDKAAVYSTHAETQNSKSDSQIWISKSKGLPLRQELDIDIGNKAQKSHFTVRFEYGNVKPPLP